MYDNEIDVSDLDKSRHWYEEKSEAIRNKSQFAYVDLLMNNNTATVIKNLRHLRMYGQNDIWSGDSFYLNTPPATLDTNRITLNVIKSVVDTAFNKIGKNKPKVMALTDGGDYPMQQKAKKLEKFVDGVFYNTDFYDKADYVFKNSVVCGTGLPHWRSSEKGKITCETEFSNDIYVDEVEGKYGKVRQLHIVKYISKDELVQRFPKHKTSIRQTATETDPMVSGVYDVTSCKYVESYVLPTGKDKGWHVMSIKGTELFKEEWNLDKFPLPIFRWEKRLVGFWGLGIAEQLVGIQVEINKTIKTIARCIHYGAIPKVFVDHNSKIIKSHINNEIGGIITFAGLKPTSEQLMRVPPELWEHLELLYGKAFELIGISQMSAQSIKPSGLDSGKAIRTYSDVESARFATYSQAWEKFFMDNAKLVIDLAKMKSEQEGGFKVTVVDDKGYEVIEWKDIDINSDQYTIKCYPKNLLSELPSGRLSDVQDLINLGVVQPDQASKLLDFPDLEEFNKFNNASGDDIMATIAAIIDDGEYNPPEPYQKLEKGIEMMQAAYLHYKHKKVNEEHLSLLIQWINDAMALTEQMMAQAQETPEEAMQSQTGAVPNPEEEMNQIPIDMTEGQEQLLAQQPVM